MPILVLYIHVYIRTSPHPSVTISFQEEVQIYDTSTPAITLAELRSHDTSQLAQDLAESLKREKKQKSRVQELMISLEKISKNSDIRHRQSAEFVNDLKRANW